jgi:hypothetical protein
MRQDKEEIRETQKWSDYFEALAEIAKDFEMRT